MKALAGKGKEEAQALLEGLIKEDVLMIPGFAFDATGGRAEPVRVFWDGLLPAYNRWNDNGTPT